MQSLSAQVRQAGLHGSSGAKNGAIRMTMTDSSTGECRLGQDLRAAHSVIHHSTFSFRCNRNI